MLSYLIVQMEIYHQKACSSLGELHTNQQDLQQFNVHDGLKWTVYSSSPFHQSIPPNPRTCQLSQVSEAQLGDYNHYGHHCFTREHPVVMWSTVGRDKGESQLPYSALISRNLIFAVFADWVASMKIVQWNFSTPIWPCVRGNGTTKFIQQKLYRQLSTKFKLREIKVLYGNFLIKAMQLELGIAMCSNSLT